MKKALTALCLLALAALLAACGTPDVAEVPKTTTEAETTAAPAEFSPTGKLYGGEFTILVSGKDPSRDLTFKDFADTEDGRTLLDEAVYKKNRKVEELYGITLKIVDDYGDPNTASARIMRTVAAGDSDYDAALIAAYDAVPLAVGKNLYELHALPGLDLTRSWWDRRASRDLNIHGCTFFTTGDITFWDDMQQHVVGFNKSVKSDLGIADNFYDLVTDGTWTHEVLARYAKLATEDLNADDRMDMQDKFGIITWDDSVYAIFGASGERVVTVEEDGRLSLTLVGSERITDVLSSYTDICFGGDAINYQRYSAAEAIKMFSGNRALFFLGRLQSLDNYRDMETDYGILPYPKYDAAQAEYYTAASPYHMTFITVPLTAADPEKSGAVLEALAYYGKEYTTPAYYEKTLTGRYFRDEDSTAILELMAKTRCYDLGLYLQPANINKELIFLFRKGDKNFASAFSSYESAATAALSTVDEAYREAAAEWQQ